MVKDAVKLAPSILAADTARLGEQVAEGERFLVHWERNSNLHRTAQGIGALGKRPGVVINPASAPVLGACWQMSTKCWS